MKDSARNPAPASYSPEVEEVIDLFREIQPYVRHELGFSSEDVLLMRDALKRAIDAGGDEFKGAQVWYRLMRNEMVLSNFK